MEPAAELVDHHLPHLADGVWETGGDAGGDGHRPGGERDPQLDADLRALRGAGTRPRRFGLRQPDHDIDDGGSARALYCAPAADPAIPPVWQAVSAGYATAQGDRPDRH